MPDRARGLGERRGPPEEEAPKASRRVFERLRKEATWEPERSADVAGVGPEEREEAPEVLTTPRGEAAEEGEEEVGE